MIEYNDLLVDDEYWSWVYIGKSDWMQYKSYEQSWMPVITKEQSKSDKPYSYNGHTRTLSYTPIRFPQF